MTAERFRLVVAIAVCVAVLFIGVQFFAEDPVIPINKTEVCIPAPDEPGWDGYEAPGGC